MENDLQELLAKQESLTDKSNLYKEKIDPLTKKYEELNTLIADANHDIHLSKFELKRQNAFAAMKNLFPGVVSCC